MIVIDTSIFISYLSPAEVNHSANYLWLTNYLLGNGQLIIPAIFIVEAAGVISRQTGDATTAIAIVDQFLELPTLLIAELTKDVAVKAANIAANLKLKGADSIFVATAAQFSVPLVSWDKEQLQRSAQLIQVFSPATYPQS